MGNCSSSSSSKTGNQGYFRLLRSVPQDKNDLFSYSTKGMSNVKSLKQCLRADQSLLIKLVKNEVPVDMSTFSVLGRNEDSLQPYNGTLFEQTTALGEKEDEKKIDSISVEKARDYVQSLLYGKLSMPVHRRVRKALGCMFGMVCGDSLGQVLEFSEVRYDSKYRLTEIMGGGYFNLRAGQWTDDASMGLCILDSFLMTYEKNEPFHVDLLDMKLRFIAWWYFGYNNPFGHDDKRESKKSIGLGASISESFEKFVENGELFTTAGDNNTSGSGAIMRLAPVPVLFWDDIDAACRVARETSLTTHQGEEAAECARLLAFICSTAIEAGESATVESILGNLGDHFESTDARVMSLARAEQEHDRDENWQWKSSHYEYSPKRSERRPGYEGSYAMDCLSMAMHCVWTTSTFKSALLKCVNIGGDADTVGSVCGQIAGAIYGVDAIPENWIDAVQQWDRNGDIALKSYLLFHKKNLTVFRQ